MSRANCNNWTGAMCEAFYRTGVHDPLCCNARNQGPNPRIVLLKSGVLCAPFNRFEIKMPREAMEDCSHSGKCDDDVAHWAPILKPLNLGIDPKAIRAELAEYGAWEDADLEDEDQNWARIVWIAASNLSEEAT